METTKKQQSFSSIWFWWFLTTVLYLTLQFAGGVGDNPSFIGYVSGFVGLFVPYGFDSLILNMTPFGLVSILFFIVSMIFVDRFLAKKGLGLGRRIMLNLLALLIITMIVDCLRLTPFMSWKIFLNGGVLKLGYIG